MHNHHSHQDHSHEHAHNSNNATKACSDGYCCVTSEKKEAPLEAVSLGNQRMSWIIDGMDCPSCAKKIEKAIQSLPSVTQAKVIFATEKLVVDSAKDISKPIMLEMKKLGYTLHLDSAAAKKSAKQKNSFFKTYRDLLLLTLLLIISSVLNTIKPQWGEIAFIVTTLFGLFPIAKKALLLLKSGSPFSIEILMSIAAIGALFIGATSEAAMVLVLFLLGEHLERYAANRARQGVSALMDLVPDDALRIEGDLRQRVAIDQLKPNDMIEIAPGERLAVDGEVMQDFANFDESALTGESMPVERKRGEEVYAGSLSIDQNVQIKVLSKPGESAIDRILTLIEEAEESRAPIERFLERFSRIYTPAILLLALLTLLIPPLLFAQSWDIWIYKSLTLLLIGCPCALVISTPAAITSGLAAATRQGALIKGGAALERLGEINAIALDKTGTLTLGKPQVTDVLAAHSGEEQAMLYGVAAVENGSHHPLARAIILYCQPLFEIIPLAENRKALAGVGIQGEVNGNSFLVCAPNKADSGVINPQHMAQIEVLEQQGKTVVVALKNNRYLGAIALQDTLRDDAKVAMQKLNTLGIKVMMLTGDNPRAAAAIASQLSIDFKASLLPQDKVSAVKALSETHLVAMVGDGINDAPAMKAAHVGIAMGSGTDVALETAEAALTHNRLIGLPDMIHIARATHNNIRQNITIALGLKALFLVTSLLGITGLWLAVLADSGATALVTANALRLLRIKKS